MPAKVRFLSKTAVRWPTNLGDGAGYRGFLKAFLNIRENQRPFLYLDKTTFDREYEAVVRKKFPDDSGRMTKVIGEAATAASQHMWQTAKDKQAANAAQHSPDVTFIFSPIVKTLNLPSIDTDVRYEGGGRGNARNEAYARETYKDFASKVTKRNPEMTFSRQTMDEALQYASARLSQKAMQGRGNAVEREKMLRRCLRRESDEYWSEYS